MVLYPKEYTDEEISIMDKYMARKGVKKEERDRMRTRIENIRDQGGDLK
jgi:hypothetical protein